MTDSFGTVELLERARCVELLGTATTGRVVFTRLAMPEVRPVRYAVRDHAIWFRVADSDIWLIGALGTVMGFTADDGSPHRAARWSVTALGRTMGVRDHRLLDEFDHVLPPTGGPADDQCVRLLIESVTGRCSSPP